MNVTATRCQPTALVNEAYLRLVGNDGDWENRRHFFGAASEAMRRILVDGARRRAAEKRGRGELDTTLNEDLHALPVPDERVLQIHEVLDQLEREDTMKAQIVKLRFFVGLKHREIGELVDLNEKTIRRHWGEAKLWLFRAIGRAHRRKATDGYGAVATLRSLPRGVQIIAGSKARDHRERGLGRRSHPPPIQDSGSP
jgi:RNA polymerase sigma factor (TIGR02999 family)